LCFRRRQGRDRVDSGIRPGRRLAKGEFSVLPVLAELVSGGTLAEPIGLAEAVLRLALACLLGAIVGLERQVHGRAAGLRTMMLVALGCALVMLASNHFAELYTTQGLTQQSVIRLDPARLAYGVMSGIGFLGAGVIIKSGVTVRGLTTSATIWCVAAIGLAAGIGMYRHAVIATALVMVALFLLHFVERRLESHWYKLIRVRLPDEAGIVERFATKLEQNHAKVLDISMERTGDGAVIATYNIRLPDRSDAPKLFEAVCREPEVKSLRLD